MANIADNLPTILPDELVQTLVRSPHVRIERIVSRGHTSPESGWYDQPQHEWVIVLQGEARIEIRDGQSHHLQAGDYLDLPPHMQHRVIWTDPERNTLWLAVHFDD